MSEIEKLPDVVYHYTTMDVLLKILEKRELWATSVKYLNDVSEHSLLAKAATEHLEAFSKEGVEINGNRFYEHDYYESESPTSFTYLPFATSFSERRDSLTHWRSYCPKGNGVSIGFFTNCLQQATIRVPESSDVDLFYPIPKFGRIEYIDSENSQQIIAILKRAHSYSVLKHDESEVLSGFLDTIEDRFFSEIRNTSGFYKSESFCDEREYRLLVSYVGFNPEIIEFRSTHSTLVPYTRLIIPNLDGSKSVQDPWNAIKSITIGPTPNMNLSMDSLSGLCSKLGMKSEICESRVAFRDW